MNMVKGCLALVAGLWLIGIITIGIMSAGLSQLYSAKVARDSSPEHGDATSRDYARIKRKLDSSDQSPAQIAAQRTYEMERDGVTFRPGEPMIDVTPDRY
jgi:hypothetical protein